MRADHNNNSRSRLFGYHSGSSSAHHYPGRGTIMPGSHARDIRRRREDRRYVGGQRGQQVTRSLADRITVDRGGQGGGRGRGNNRHHAQGTVQHRRRGQGGNFRPLVDRITGGNGTGLGRVGTNTTAPGNGFGTNICPTPNPQQFQVASEVGAQESIFPFDPLFDEPQEPQTPQAPTRVSFTARTPEVRTAVAIQRPKPTRVVKKPGHFIENPKLRGILLGTKPRAPKRHDAMLLRVAQTTRSLQGHELTCASPDHSNFDGYDGGDE